MQEDIIKKWKDFLDKELPPITEKYKKLLEESKAFEALERLKKEQAAYMKEHEALVNQSPQVPDKHQPSLSDLHRVKITKWTF